MHRPKMRPILLTAVAALIGVVAIVFGLVHTSNNAQATTPVGVWKLMGQITIKAKNPPAHTVMIVNYVGKPLTKGMTVVIVSNPPDPLQDFPKRWRVTALKAGLLSLEAAQPNQCGTVVAPPPAGAGTRDLYTGPCPKPVVPGAGNANHLSGIYDLVVDGGVVNADFFHCMARFDINVGGTLKFAAQCFDNLGALGAGGGEPENSAFGEGVNPDPTGGTPPGANKTKCPGTGVLLDCYGPPPPPPYASTPPIKSTGTYIGDKLTFTLCFPDAGNSVNAIGTLNIPNAQAQLVGVGGGGIGPGGKLVGSALIYLNQPNSACDTLTPIGPPPGSIGATLYPATNIAKCPAGICQHVPWRQQTNNKGGYPDWDGDGCTDADELWAMKPGVATKCGDDPWNPNDVTPPSTNASGSYDITAVAARVDCNPALTGDPAVCEIPGDLVPGFYYSCKADIQQAGKNLTARVQCYIDSPLVVVNPKAPPANIVDKTTCGPVQPAQAPAAYCGDGISGAPPPGILGGVKPGVALFAKIGRKHDVLTGVVDNAQNVIKLNGCFESDIISPPETKGVVGTLVNAIAAGTQPAPTFNIVATALGYNVANGPILIDKELFTINLVTPNMPVAGQTTLRVTARGPAVLGGKTKKEAHAAGAIVQQANKVSFLGNTYARAVVNLHTGHGQANIWSGQTNNDCKNGTPVGAGGVISVQIVRQAPGHRAKDPAQALVSITCDANPVPGTRHFVTAAPHQMLYGGTIEVTGAAPGVWNGRYPVIVDLPTKPFTETAFRSVPKDGKPKTCPAANTVPGSYVPVRDSDGDNCPDKKELGDNPAFGGLRDPYNHYDYFNPTQDKLNRVDDILKVVNQYFIDDPVGMPDNKSNTDRTAVPGANAWNLSKPNGQQRVDDILAAVKQYFHDC